MKPFPGIDAELERRVEDLGFEVVDVHWGGGRGRPRIRVRIDFDGSEPGRGVTVDDCARVSRALEEWLDEHPALPERYVLEVSSPGVERPLIRRRDFARFSGNEIEIRRRSGGAKGSAQLFGELVGVYGEGESDYGIVVVVADGSEVRIPRDQIERANLVFRWNE